MRELAILAVARDAQAEYEWIQHVAIAKQVGATDEHIRALEERGTSAFSDAQRAAIELAEVVVSGPRVDDDLFSRLQANFDDREIVELLLAIGDYLMLARVMTVLEIDLDEPATTGAIVAS